MTNAADQIRAVVAGVKRLSTIWIVIGNLIPLICVIAFGWPAGVLLLLYWCENVILGGINVLKMTASSLTLGPGGLIILLFLVPFFTFHYGLFCMVHGVFVVVIGSVGGGGLANAPGGLDPSPFTLWRIVLGQIQSEPGFGWSLATIGGMQLFSLVFDWLARRRYRDVSPMEQMAAPYGRIVVLHIALLGGGFLIALWGSPVGALAVLVVMKTLFDLGYVAVADRKAKGGDDAALADQREKLSAAIRKFGQKRA
ncbi:MAG: hypothetical protein KF842_01725 [Caulobacter sp.]|nr:hypothetical protein [Caulobacter sp.]